MEFEAKEIAVMARVRDRLSEHFTVGQKASIPQIVAKVDPSSLEGLNMLAFVEWLQSSRSIERSDDGERMSETDRNGYPLFKICRLSALRSGSADSKKGTAKKKSAVAAPPPATPAVRPSPSLPQPVAQPAVIDMLTMPDVSSANGDADRRMGLLQEALDRKREIESVLAGQIEMLKTEINDLRRQQLMARMATIWKELRDVQEALAALV